MTDIPEDILNTARTVADKSCHDYTVNVLTIARAILAERERCASIVIGWRESDYPEGFHSQSAEHLAEQIAKAIREGTEQ